MFKKFTRILASIPGIISACKPVKVIRYCHDSFIIQTVLPSKIIDVDDDSTNDTLNTIKTIDVCSLSIRSAE
jgi:hypothetical protein